MPLETLEVGESHIGELPYSFARMSKKFSALLWSSAATSDQSLEYWL
jgi:hypothetical protein